MQPQTNLPTQRLVGYVRGSTEEQQNTLTAQQEQMEGYCQYQKFELSAVFVDSGTSGSTSFYERPRVAEMLAYMSTHNCTGVIITKLDRGFRNAIDCLFTVEDFKQRGLDLHILDMKLDTSSAIGRMILGVLASLAQFENDQRCERQHAAFAVMRDAHRRCGTIPYGWQPVAALRTARSGRQAQDLIPHPEEYPTLLWILRRHTEGTSDNQIARELNAQGTPAKRGGKWFGATVQSVRAHALLADTQGKAVAA